MNTLLSVIPIVARRVVSNARLLAAVVIGAVLASALMSTTSIYTDAIRDLGLSHAIKQRGQDKINISIRAGTESTQNFPKDREYVESTAKQALGPLVKQPPTALSVSQTFFPSAPGEPAPIPETRPRGNLIFMTGIEPHLTLVTGALPKDAPPYTDGPSPTIEAAMGDATARRLNLKVGDRFDLHPFWMLEAEPVHLVISGIVDPVDLNEPYWHGERSVFEIPSNNWDTLPFLVTQKTYTDTVAAYLTTMTSDIDLLIYLDTSPIDARNAKNVQASVSSFENQIQLNLPRADVTTQLSDVLATFDQKLFFTRVPLLVLVLQIAGIVLYYLFMVSTMLVERQAGEIALLKSRGATTLQVMQIYALEGFAIMAIALALGPPLAALVISLLGHTPPFADLSGGSNLHVHLSATAYLWALSGAVLAYAMLLWPAFQATRATVVQQRTASARPPKQAAFTRYYLDLVLVGVGALLFFQLNRKGSLVTDKLFGEQTIDPVMLLTPAFFILTVGIVFLRLFPVVLRGVAWLVSRFQGTAVLIAMWQLVRNPTHYSRLVLLLMLATAVGMFAASFGATLDRSYADRAAYQSGAPLRISEIRRSPASGPRQLPASLQETTGAKASTPVLRLSGSQGTTFNRNDFDFLGVDPATFPGVAYFRNDFAAKSLSGLMKDLKQDPPAPGPSIPAGARWAGMWLNPTDLKGRVGLDMQVTDATGRPFVFTFGPEAGLELPNGWSFLVSDLTRPAQAPGGNIAFANQPPQAPFTVVTIAVRFLTRVSALTGSMQLDDLQVTNDASLPGALATERLLNDPSHAAKPFQQSQLISGFDTADGWAPLQGLLPIPLNDQTRAVAGGAQSGALELNWRPVQGNPSTHGLRPKSADDAPLPVLASDGFLTKTAMKVGDTTQVYLGGMFINVRIVDTFSLFATLGDSRMKPALIADLAQLQPLINILPRFSQSYSDEVWLSGVGPGGVTRARDLTVDNRLVGNVVSLDELREAQKKDPLVAAGWQGILFLSFAAILILSAIGFLIYSYLTAQKRTLEFAVLRTMGFSRKQIAAVVGFEQCFVIGLGMIAGTLMGLRLGVLMIKYMGVTETGAEVLPPMAQHVSWLTMGSAWLILAMVFATTIGVVVLMYSRLALHRVLRIGET